MYNYVYRAFETSRRHAKTSELAARVWREILDGTIRAHYRRSQPRQRAIAPRPVSPYLKHTSPLYASHTASTGMA